VKYPILVLGAAVALIAAAPPTPTPTPAPTASPAAEYSAAPLYTAAPGASAMPPATPTPSLDQMMGPQRGRARATQGASPKASPTPPPVRKGVDGVWEVQIQRGANTEYEHFKLKQAGSTITGTYLTQDKKRYPIAGSVDGSNVRLVVSLPDGTTILLAGRVDNDTDMLGMFTDAKESVPFTAAYRPKEKWIENINASPGGLGGQGGYLPPK
jgi:hypothetical protein